MKKVFIWIVFALLILSLCSCAKKDTDIDNYEEVVQEYKASAFMPELDEVGVYENIKYLSRYEHSFFPIDTIQLIVEYDEENFLKEKERLDTAYTYLDKPQLDEANDDFYTIPVERFSTAGFDFRVAVFEDSDFPEEFGMVGISEEKREIAYLWVYSIDLDYICTADADRYEEMCEFVEENFELE